MYKLLCKANDTDITLNSLPVLRRVRTTKQYLSYTDRDGNDLYFEYEQALRVNEERGRDYYIAGVKVG